MLRQKAITPAQTVDARKQPLNGDAAWPILAATEEILIARGKGFQRFDPKSDAKEAILDQALGRSGTLRAPALRIGPRLLIGYSDPLYAHFFQ